MSGSPRLWRHFKRNFLGYAALVVAISMTPLPAYAASKIGAKQLKVSFTLFFPSPITIYSAPDGPTASG